MACYLPALLQTKSHRLTQLYPACMHPMQTADVWSCGVMLYVMLVGAYPFERPEDKHDNQKLQKMIQVGAEFRASWLGGLMGFGACMEWDE